MAAPGGHQWSGADTHGFISEGALRSALAEAHGRPLNVHEACAVVMNPHLFATSSAPPDGADELSVSLSKILTGAL
jgi:hypothetical protein